ncbi:MAG TPA: lytic transglycosylase domain-containing protein [Candidatus Acidoferrales bacterium]|nr:lytic transglycosylase domain-containing protein [Candidatus Acidoferrales bacterium]
MTPLPELIGLAQTTAARFNLNPALVCAVIEEESSWDTYAIRYEPLFRRRYVRPLKLPSTEEVARSTSWGLMQVMGQVAREHGFKGRFLSEICSPAVGVEVGCIVFAKKMADAGGDAARTLLLWNGGDNPEYPSRVLNKMLRYSSS